MTAVEAPASWRDRIVGQGSEEPEQLLANPANWRIHPAGQQRALEQLLDEVGWVGSVLVNRTTGHIVDGHLRVELAISRGEPTVPVTYVELTQAEEDAVLMSLDPIGAMAVTDADKLSELLARTPLQRDLAEAVNALLPAGSKVGLTDPDEAPPAPEEPWVQRGELWLLGEHRLLVGDATVEADVARLMALQQADVLWTDPPYGVAYEGGTAERLTIENDDLGAAGTRALVGDALRLVPLRRGGVFWIAAPSGPMHLPFLLALEDAGLAHRQTVIWVKTRFVLGHSDFHYRHEPLLVGEPDAPKEHQAFAYGWADGDRHVYLGGRKLDTVWEIARPSASREHPTMKPHELVARALEVSSRVGDLVVDPFAGSGTTLIAAETLGRRCYAMELDPRYAQVIIERWQAHTGLEASRG